MKYCSKCGTQLEDTDVVCSNCGEAVVGLNGKINVFDHTSEFTSAEISEGKVFGLAVYLLGVIGIIIALLACRDNKFVAFHVKNSLKIEICLIISIIVCIIPVLGWFVFAIYALVSLVLIIMAFLNVCKGKAVDSPIIRNFGFLK
ncbi:MAG: DUF4870 domain-containing protein [Lachnospiraceae bacterium]|nr:DUF4870 domain-containing protein [Lachnospiraceae bacterium]